MKKSVLFYFLVTLFFGGGGKSFASRVTGSDSLIMRLDSVSLLSGNLKINLSFINQGYSKITIVKPSKSFLDYNLITIDIINKYDPKKGYNTNQISKNLQLDHIVFKDTSQIVVINPFTKVNFEIVVPKDFFQKDLFFDNLKNCHLVIWYEHDISYFEFKIPVQNVFNGTLISESSSTVRSD